MIFKLPWPPSVNHYYVNHKRVSKAGKEYMGRGLTERGLSYRNEVSVICYRQDGSQDRMEKNIVTSWEFYPPDKRRRDYDNLFKAMQDSLTHAGVWKDDLQVKECHWYEREISKPGYVLVQITEI